MGKFVQHIQRAYDRFLFESCSAETCVLLRILYALLLTVYVSVWMLEGKQWFSDEGVMSVDSARAVLGSTQWSLFYSIEATPALVQLGLGLLMLNSLLLLFGFFSRFQAASIFFWLVSFQHRNPLICDGEDTVFRLMAFFFIFLPLDHTWSLSRKLFGTSPNSIDPKQQAWGLRLIQVQMSLIYLSAAWSKWEGNTWRDGSALYYVFQMGDLFGRGWLPSAILESESVIRYSTWAVVIVEALLPLALWWRPTRKLAVLVGIGLHLTIEYSMHLFLFQWIMIVGLLSFVDPRDWRWRGRLPQATTEKAPAHSPHSTPLPLEAPRQVALQGVPHRG